MVTLSFCLILAATGQADTKPTRPRSADSNRRAHSFADRLLGMTPSHRERLAAAQAAGVMELAPVHLPTDPPGDCNHYGWPVATRVGKSLVVMHRRIAGHRAKGAGGPHPQMSYGVVLRSDDGGRTWSAPYDLRDCMQPADRNRGGIVPLSHRAKFDKGNRSPRGYKVHLHALGTTRDGGVIAVNNHGVFRSDDAGRTWRHFSRALREDTFKHPIINIGPRILDDPKHGLLVFGNWFGEVDQYHKYSEQLVVLRSADRGATWNVEQHAAGFKQYEPAALFHGGRYHIVTRDQNRVRSHRQLTWSPGQKPTVKKTNLEDPRLVDTVDLSYNPVTQRFEIVRSERHRMELWLWSIAPADWSRGTWRRECRLFQRDGKFYADADGFHPAGAVIDEMRRVQHIFFYSGHPNGPAGVFRLTRSLDTPRLVTILNSASGSSSARPRKKEMWPENRGPNHNYHLQTSAAPPKKWSVIENRNISWRRPLPETGHSGIAIASGRLFLTCFRRLTSADYNQVGGRAGTWVSETRGYCLDAQTGKILWSCDLPGKRPNQVNGTFTDSTTPTPVTDGKHVWFFNAGGYMACHTLEGKRVWSRPFSVRTKHSAKQFQPFLHAGRLYYAMLRDKNDPERRPQTAEDWDKNSKAGWPWMYVRCFDAKSGSPLGILPDGISVHSKGALGKLGGQTVLLHARGGGHSPPEKPYGLSLSRLTPKHELLWSRPGLPFEGSHTIDDKYAYCFDRNSLYVLDLASGKTLKKIRVRGVGEYRRFDEQAGKYVRSSTPPRLHRRHLVTHRTNIAVGRRHFFLSSAPGVLGCIDLETNDVQYVQVPIQVQSVKGKCKLSWKEFTANDDNAHGFVIRGDMRRHGHGFGHISAATPIVVNDCIYFSTVLGTVYVVDAKAKNFDENALIAVNDLGPPGKTWTLAPFSCADGRLYQRTSREILCIGSAE